MMEHILFLAHTQAEGEAVGKIVREVFGAACTIKHQISETTLTVGLIGEKIQAATDSLIDSSVSIYVGVEGTDFSVSRYGTDRLAIETLMREVNPTLVVVPHTQRFARVMPGVAQRFGAKIDTHVSGIHISENRLHVQRWYYRQRMSATFSRSGRPWFLLVDSGVGQKVSTQSGAAALKILNVTAPDLLKQTRVVGIEKASSGAETIRPDADLLFVAGAGWTKKQSDGQIHAQDAEALILAFLEKTKASLGSSKSLVDQSGEGTAALSFLSHLNQVGQTGSSPRHPKGLSTCCHGEEPHAVGWRFVNERRAVNLDPNCGWAHGKADVLYVADAFQVMSKVNELLDAELAVQK